MHSTSRLRLAVIALLASVSMLAWPPQEAPRRHARHRPPERQAVRAGARASSASAWRDT